MRWKAYVDGKAIDLGILVSTYPARPGAVDLAVGQDEGGTFFESSRLDALAEMSGEGHRLAQQVVREMNGAARVLDSSFRPVRLQGRYQNGNDNIVQIVAAETAEVRVRIETSAVVTGQDGQAVPAPPPVGPQLLALADTSSAVADALALLGTPATLGWFELYKLYEIVTHEVDVVVAGWTSKADMKAFTASANRHDVSGVEARHARNSGAPPRRTMTISEATDYMTAVARAWMESLL